MSDIEHLLKESVERVKKMTPFERALMYARQRRSWVTGEMALGNDSGKGAVPIEEARKIYDCLPEGALLSELERRMAGDAPEVGQRAAHYGAGRQPWDDILDVGWGPAFAAGNALKYIRRHAAKNGEDDLKKGRWYFHELRKLAAAEEDEGQLGNACRALDALMKMTTHEEHALLG